VTLSGCALQADPDLARPPLYVEAPEISDAAARSVGAERARQAAADAVSFALEYGFTPGLLDPQKVNFTAEELSAGVTNVLTPSSLAVWNARVVAALAGDQSAREEIRALRMYDLQDPKLSSPPDGKTLRSQAITDLAVDLFAGQFPDPEAPSDDSSGRSDSNLAPLATVTASSVDEEERSFAEAAVDGSVLGYPVDATKEWSTAYEYDGSWIQLTWESEVTLNRVVLHDRPNLDDHVLAGTLTFSDGSTVAVGRLSNEGTATTVTFPPREVTSVRFTVGSVADSTWATGLSEFEAWGTSSDSSLLVRFTHEARFRYLDQRIPFELVFTRDVVYRMTPPESTTVTAGREGATIGSSAAAVDTNDSVWRIVEYAGPYRISEAERLTR